MSRKGEWMLATGWKGGTYGVWVGPENAARYFNRSWTHIHVLINGRYHEFALTSTFWTSCPEFRGAAIREWFLQEKIAPWPYRQPPRLVLTSLGGGRFSLSL
jgi:hypothetical protein